MKRLIKYFSIVLFSAFFMFLVASDPASAAYDQSKNNTWVSVTKSEIKITVQYQRGFYQDFAVYRWFNVNPITGELTTEISVDNATNYEVNYVNAGGDPNLSYIALGDASHADNNLTTYTFTVPAQSSDFPDGDKVLGNLSTYTNSEKIALVVDTYYCVVRNVINGEVQPSCQYSDNNHPGKKKTVVIDVSDMIEGSGFGNTDIEDANIEGLMTKIKKIVNNTIMPILWVVLGLFLIVKGTLIGVQIVKAADEPQVRQEKVGSLKWLVIGVAIAYASTFVVKVVIGFFENTFK